MTLRTIASDYIGLDVYLVKLQSVPMPKSKSKRRRYQPPPPPNPKPSPKWVPVLFFVFLGVGFFAIIFRYVLSQVPFFDNDLFLWGGLILIAGAFGVATQWR